MREYDDTRVATVTPRGVGRRLVTPIPISDNGAAKSDQSESDYEYANRVQSCETNWAPIYINQVPAP